jgi:uncharacterized membrane protein YjdF
MVVAGYVAYTSGILRGWELAAVIVLFPVASLAVGFLIEERWVLWLPSVAAGVTLLGVPAILAVTQSDALDAQSGIIAIYLAAGGTFAVWLGQSARTMVRY